LLLCLPGRARKTPIATPRLPVVTIGGLTAPLAPFVHLTALWIQVTGTWCNLECTHCLNASGPKEPWLKPLASETARAAIVDGERLGVKEIYFTGGEPFLHKDILPLLQLSLSVAPTTVLTNGTVITDVMADALAALAQAAAYSLELRVSLDDVDPELNDGVRGRGAWAKAVRAVRLLNERGLVPIVTATEILSAKKTEGGGIYQRFRDFLLAEGVTKPRVKILPVFPIGRMEGRSGERLTEEELEGFDRGQLQCAETRVVASGGVYACPILSGLPGARLSDGELEASFRPAPLYHPACVTCHRTGMTCRNA
jgi:sulfatase maturation enzyme AslB (radical SAM superfamily)